MADTPHSSSQIETINYDAGAKSLQIRFKGGATYVYVDVDRALYDDLRAYRLHPALEPSPG